MKHNRYLLTMALLVAGTISAFSQVSNDNEDEVYKIDAQVVKNDFVPGQVLVKFKDGNSVTVNRTRGVFNSVNNSAINDVLKEFDVENMDKLLPNAKPKQTRRKTRAFNGKEVEEKDLSQLFTLKIRSMRKDSTMMLVGKLKELGEVEYAEPNYKIYMMGQVPSAMPETQAVQAKLSRKNVTRTTDEYICTNPEQNPLYAQQWGISYLKVNELWNKPIINSKRPVIAILDTGVDITHPDIVENIWTKPGTEDEHGYDFINETYNIRDYNSHGTHVAGIAAASNNETGIVGANPQALIMPITVMQPDGTGDIQVLIKGIQYAIDNGADVINMSLGTYAYSQALREVLMTAYQGSVLVAAAGNDARPLNECVNRNDFTMFPAGYNFVLGVQASSSSGGLAGFSNSDCNGPTYSEYNLDDAENYELTAPGTNIVSCIPSGKYKSLNGTSMSAPLVAGAISALKMVKEYNSPEIMWADLIHSDCDFLATYNIKERKPDIEVMTLVWNDTEDGGNGDGHYDAGETVRFYPIVRTVWGEADNIKFHLDYANEYDDHSLVEIIQNDVDFGWNLSAYAYETSKNPIIFKVADNCPDNRHIQLRLTVSCEGAINPTINQDFTLVVDNVIKLHGLQSEDLTLSPNHKYLVSGDYAILEDVTLTIEPGTNLMFREGVTFDLFGTLNAVGEPGNMITFERHVGDGGPYIINLHDNYLKYCVIDGAGGFTHTIDRHGEIELDGNSFLENCIISNSEINNHTRPNCIKRSNIISISYEEGLYGFSHGCINCNMVNNDYDPFRFSWGSIHKSNFFDNIITERNKDDDFYNDHILLVFKSETPAVQANDNPAYLGTSREDLVRPHVKDMNYGDGVGNGYGVVDLSNMLTEPVHEAHGIVWKVLVDGIDPQDQYEIMPPIGVGKHKFEVYFNRPMNKAVIPNVAFGVRYPYNQNAVDENGAWNDEGTIYTAYKTVTGKTQSDGLNRINVWGAEDDEFFECPYENWRFRIHIQSAGSLATGFAASAGMGKVNLTWDNTNNDFDDAMGFNIYRYTIDNDGVADTICINKEIVDIETTEFTDYDVIPGTTYYYLYRVLSTGLKEYDVSNVVSATPLTSTLGDANGSGDVDVADVITTVNYATGMNPKPFIFEAADMNADQLIDILDVVGIIQKILNPIAGARAMAEATATYTIEDGFVFVDTPVELAGVQIQLATDGRQEMTVTDDLKGFEHASAWLSENDYLFMAYNLNGKTLPAGKHAILYVGDAQVTNIKLSNIYGNSVNTGNGTTGIDRMGKDIMNTQGVFNLKGQKVAGSANMLDKLPNGVYIIDGVKVVK